MPLSSGTRLGPYEILAAIGAGGMGEVYKACDTRLDRSVAIKILPAHVSADPERRARFEREAKTIAGLNHSHICTLYDVGESEGSTFLVMEHLTGETLAQRLEKGPLPLEQALSVATEIADALSAAHRHGVVHRDLKPGNVMLTKGGAKLLDFGLAKLKGQGEQPAAARLASAPTQSTPLTGEGMIVGTLQYMAPEQLEGKPADARTDLWALGAILYEMATGKRAFEGTSPASLIGAILEREPVPLSTLQPLTPSGVDRLVRRCLAKQPEDRWDTAHDVGDELRWLQQTSGIGVLAPVQPRRSHGVRKALVAAGGLAMAVAAAFALATLAGLVTWKLRPSPSPGLTGVIRLWEDVTPADRVDTGTTGSSGRVRTRGGTKSALTLSPDGRSLAFVGVQGDTRRLYLRSLSRNGPAQPLDGTEGALIPLFSPDGRWIVFWTSVTGQLKKVPVAGGGPVAICGLGRAPHGLSWRGADALVFDGGGATGAGLSTVVAEAGSTPQVLTTTRREEVAHRLPQVLPGAQSVLFVVRKSDVVYGSEKVAVQSLVTGERREVLSNATDARYVASGHLVFMRDGSLWAAPFDLRQLRLTGPAQPVVEGVAHAAGPDEWSGTGQFAVSDAGTLAFIPGGLPGLGQVEMIWIDRTGHQTPSAVATRPYHGSFSLSPDGHRVAITVQEQNAWSVWTINVDRGDTNRLTFDGEQTFPLWTPDGQGIVNGVIGGGDYYLVERRADGTGEAKRLTPPTVRSAWPLSWMPDSKTLAFEVEKGLGGYSAYVMSVDDPESMHPLDATPREVPRTARFSPKGQWLAYASDEIPGETHVFVRAYPGPGPKLQVSTKWGNRPVWNPNGRELFYVTREAGVGGFSYHLAAVDVSRLPAVGATTRLFSTEGLIYWDVSPDGRFLASRRLPEPPVEPVTHVALVLNWFEELKAKVPTGR